MDIRKVKKLIEMLEASNLEEIEIQEGEESVRLVKNKTHGTIRNDVEITKEIGVGKENKQETLEEELGDKITSPMVGTFYSAPSPGAKPFISVGDEIQEGDIVCIVEAMKMMNEIKSDFSGKVSSILVENAEPVEFGQGLFLIK
tara:strand:- start:953 stop:1384 length:432 start_codon:yes stop_codon:yes gene_type:complete